ncbi:hypothetical protein A2U01_0013122, partial [Trifolium medium]|nr:hypothetical protein [Trifolium medium]
MTGRSRETHGNKPINKNCLQKAGRGTQGKPPISKNCPRVLPGSLAIANNRMRQQKAPSAVQKAP